VSKVENPYGHALTFQRLKNGHQIRDRSGKPIQLGGNQDVALPAPTAAEAAP
jgi:hypothetical protein